MESVVLRYHKIGMSIEEIRNRTSLPIEFVAKAILAVELKGET